MSDTPNDYKEISHYPLVFVITSLPIKPLQAGAIWQKKNGKITVTLNPAAIETSKGLDNTLPSGKIARAVMHYLVSTAKKNDSRFITLPPSTRALLKEMGLPVTGRSTVEVIDQMRKILTMSIVVTTKGKGVGPDGTKQLLLGDMNYSIGEATNFILDAEEGSLSPGSVIELSEKFMATVRNRKSLPLDDEKWRGVITATKSALPIDVYLWLSFKLPRLADNPVEIPWIELHEQFGSQMKDIRNFRTQFIEALDVAKSYYPDAQVEIYGAGSRGGDSGVRIRKSPPALPYRPQ